MSYGVAAALQAAIFAHLSVDPALAGLAIFDAPPPGPLPETYALVGPETVRDRSDASGAGALHLVTVSVITQVAGFQAAKVAAAALSDRLNGAALTLARGRLVGLRFERAIAAREGTDTRRIDLRFAARVEDN